MINLLLDPDELWGLKPNLDGSRIHIPYEGENLDIGSITYEKKGRSLTIHGSRKHTNQPTLKLTV